MSDFDSAMGERQVAWRIGHMATTEHGRQNGVERPWILPASDWELGLWKGIRKNSDRPLARYLEENGVQPHTGKHNLKSSWVLCANLYFPFRYTEQDRAILTGFLRANVDPAIESVDRLELEYEEPGDLHPSKLLGEAGGARGSGQTSPDLAFVVNGGRGLVLVESKFTEHSFYRCSARRTTGRGDRKGNHDLSRCERALEVIDDPAAACHQEAWKQRYWSILAPVARQDHVAQLTRCPAATAGYQLLRQQALAEGIARSGRYDLVVSCVAWDERNPDLRDSLTSTGINDFRDWGALFAGKAKFRTFTHQAWVGWIRSNAGSEWAEWLSYVEGRYGL